MPGNTTSIISETRERILDKSEDSCVASEKSLNGFICRPNMTEKGDEEWKEAILLLMNIWTDK